jgi:hypothetical protein
MLKLLTHYAHGECSDTVFLVEHIAYRLLVATGVVWMEDLHLGRWCLARCLQEKFFFSCCEESYSCSTRRVICEALLSVTLQYEHTSDRV